MIAEAGLAALWLAAALSLLQLAFGIASLVLPAREAGGEGDRPKDGGGAEGVGLPLHHASHGPPPHGFAAGRTSPYAAAIRPIAVVQAALVGLSFLA
ncbi:MAG TPA: hypothetical protein VF652_12045, partial [Allosphingosinicella sp.]